MRHAHDYVWVYPNSSLFFSLNPFVNIIKASSSFLRKNKLTLKEKKTSDDVPSESLKSNSNK